MERSRIAAWMATLAAGMALIAQGTPGQSGQIKVLCSDAIKVAVQKVLPDAEKAIGLKISIEFSASTRFQKSIKEGAAFDLAILTPGIIDDLIKSGKIAEGTHTDIASADLAVGVKAGSPKADVSTPEGMKKRLLAAKTLTWTDGGASSAAIMAMLKGLGVEEQVKSKIVLQTIPGRPGESVANGENELMFAPVSEVGTIKGVEVLGYFPKEYQRPVVVTAGIATQAKDAAGAKALVRFLLSPKAAPAIKATGMKVAGTE